MKKLLLNCLAILAVISPNFLSAQNNLLYSGNRNSTDLVIYDTTGAIFTNTITRPMSGAGITKSIGLTNDPSTAEFYILFEDGNGEISRRIGTVDTLTGVVTDIALVGNIQYIEFATFNNKLYGTYGNSGSNSGIVEINTTTGALTDVIVRAGDWGSCLAYNAYNTSLYNFSGDNGTFVLDLNTMIETDLDVSTPEEMTGTAVINDSTILVFGRNNPMYSFNTNTNTYTNLSTSMVTGLHGLSFGSDDYVIICTGNRTFCSTTPSILSSPIGSTFQWYLDGNILTTETNSTYTPLVSGVYSCVIDGETSKNQISITVNESPIASFTATPNPVDLTADPSGMTLFTNTSTGPHDLYDWDFDNGIYSTNENVWVPLSTNNGSFDVSLTVTNSVTGCSATSIQTINVINALNIEELGLSLSAFPNPTKDFVTIESKDGNFNASILDLKGNELKTFKIKEGKNNTIDIASYSAGLYLIKVEQDGKIGYIRLIKE